MSYFNHAIELDPNFAAAYQALGHCYGNVGEVNLSQETIKKAFALRHQVSEREKFSIAADYYSQVTGELDKAGQQYELLLQYYPRDGEAHNNLGGLYSTFGDYERAAKEALAAAETDPKLARALWQLRGMLLERGGLTTGMTDHCKSNNISIDVVAQMIPYLVTVVILAGFIGRATPPASLGVPYEKEAR